MTHNNYTEEEAKEKVCRQCSNHSMSDVFIEQNNLKWSEPACIGSKCMHWQWDTVFHIDVNIPDENKEMTLENHKDGKPLGYCGLARRT